MLNDQYQKWTPLIFLFLSVEMDVAPSDSCQGIRVAKASSGHDPLPFLISV